ncbi:hypothetical protein C8R43DRAFT_928396 [Mycena crocata]|nr:hypothetical protein C8R43DRAFT_928396 [Mycena crocata]
MSTTAHFSLDILRNIMLQSSTIEEKFTVSQVSQVWRSVALNTPRLWSSFTDNGKTTRMDCHRLPILLERTGATTVLHIRLRFTEPHADWTTAGLTALVPYAARIETLDIELTMSLPDTSLLQSNLHFPALETLRLKGAEHGATAVLSLSAPQLRILDVERFVSPNWDQMLVPSLEDISLCFGNAEIGTLAAIFERCPAAWRVVLREDDEQPALPFPADRYDFTVPRRTPLAPALRELELELEEEEIGCVLRNGFVDVALETVTACIYEGPDADVLELLTGTLLFGVGPLLVYSFDGQKLEVRDGAGHVRRLQCWDDFSGFEIPGAWVHLSMLRSLHKSVREIRIPTDNWEEYAEAFVTYPPQSEVVLCLRGTIPEQSEEITTMRIPGLTKVELSSEEKDEFGCADTLTISSILDTLVRLEPPSDRTVEVCIRDPEFKTGDFGERTPESSPFSVLKTALPKPWVVCNHCLIARASEL